MENRNTAPVGVFDSGVGGLTVAREISRQLPNENIVYFGDTARVPYGSKSQNRIFRGYSESSIRKQIAEYDYPLFGTDHPFSENKRRQGYCDRL